MYVREVIVTLPQKMMSRYSLFLLVTSIFFFNYLQAQFEVSAEIRPRLEFNNGFGFTPSKSSEMTTYVSQRSRLNFKYDREKFGLYFSLQDARVWGDEDIANNTAAFANTKSTGFHEAWLEFKPTSYSRIKIGRQEFVYDDQRLLANRNWTMHGVAYDAVLFGLTKKDWIFDLAFSYNNDASKGQAAGAGINHFEVDPIARRLRTLNFIYVKKQLSKDWYVSALGMMTGYQKDKTTSTIYLMATYGLHSHYKKNRIDARVNLYAQSGKSQKGKKVQAWMATAEAAYLAGAWRFDAGMDVLSGHDFKQTDADYTKTEHNFDLFYGIRYLRYGFMNQFVLPSGTAEGGLTDIHPGIQYSWNKKNKISADYHLFYLNNPVIDPFSENTFVEGSLGSELDLVWHHQFYKELTLNAGFCYYFTNDIFARVKKIQPDEIGTPYYAWLMITFKPVLFRSSELK